MKPSEIVTQLNRHVIGQDDAQKILAVAVYSHFRKVEMVAVDRLEMLKSNLLLIGPTGTGKTLLCETLARVLELPFVTADATSLAQTEYVNEELDAILQRLLERYKGHLGNTSDAAGITRRTLYTKMKAYGLDAADYRGA